MDGKSQGKKVQGVPGKKKVIRRLVKNAKTGEIIKTEIVRIDSSGEMTVTSYPAGAAVPSLTSLQSQGNSQTKKTSKKPSESTEQQDQSATSQGRRKSESSSSTRAPSSPPLRPDQIKQEPKPLPRAYEEPNPNPQRADMGPSVPANVPGLEDLIKREEELRKAAESQLDQHESLKTVKQENEESIETALISIMKRKRQRDPKSRRRGLAASTMHRRTSDEEIDKALDDAYAGDTDYRRISSKKDAEEDEEAERKRKERHRRRREKRQKGRNQDVADKEDVEEYQGETGPLDMPVESSRKRHEEEVPMETAPESQEGGGEEAELAQQLEDTSIQKEDDTQPMDDKDPVASDDEDDKKKKKKKRKHKKKKKKQKKQKKRDEGSRSRSGSGSESKEERKKRSRSKSRSLSRARSLSSISLSSISSTFSDNFDFAGMDFDPSEEASFDMAMAEYQMMRGGFMAPFPGPGFNPAFFRGHGNFRGFPRGRARGRGFPFPGRGGRGGFMPFFPGDPNFEFGPYMVVDQANQAKSKAQPVSKGPWRGRGLRGRGVPPGFHFNYTEDDTGGCVYVKDTSSSSESDSEKKKKKKKHKRRSYSSRSYSSSNSRSSRSRSRSRRKHRRHHRSSSYSSYSRSSGSYSRSSYSSRSRSHSRSYSRSSRSYSSYSSKSYSRSRSRSSRSRSGSQKREGSKPWDWASEDGGRRASPSYQAFSTDNFKPPTRHPESDEEEVPWWAEFDKTYEVEKKKLEEEKKKLEDAEKQERQNQEEAGEPQAQSIVSTEEIDVVRCMMNLIDKTRSQQDDVLETCRECVNDMIKQICTAPTPATQLHEESRDPFEKIIHDCVDSILDRVCPNDPQTAARMCLKEIIDTVVEQEEEDQANEKATEMEKEITESSQSRLFQCYLQAQKLTEQIKAQRRAKDVTDEGAENEKQQENEKPEKNDGHRRSDRRRGKRHRRRSRSRSRSRDRGRRRRRGRSSSDSRSRSSSRSSERKMPLVSKESLQQAQAVLLMQQQQLEVAGLLGTGMPNLAGLNQAAALAAGIQPAVLPKAAESATVAKEEAADSQTKFSKWDKDKDAMLKTKSKDDLTRKLMQRMREKKQQQEEAGDMSPTFLARNKDKGSEAAPDKVFTGPQSLKSRKIAISANFGKLWSKVEGSPRQDDDSQDSTKAESKIGYNKSDIVAATTDAKEQLANAERMKAEENEKKLAMWSDQQARLKEEAKREMREQIERAERAKKEKMKEEILEQERQKEIARIREEVRNQIRKEIQEEIEKQRKTVLEDPGVREKLLELEALRSESGKLKTDVLQPATSGAGKIPESIASSMATGLPPVIKQDMPDQQQRWFQHMMKTRKDMQIWMESHRYFESEMDENQMKMMQLRYMQQWPQHQRQEYMRWFWQSNLFKKPPGYFQQPPPIMPRPLPGSQSSSNQMQRLPDKDHPMSRMHDPNFRGHESTFTHAPSQGPQGQQRQDSTRPTDAGFPRGEPHKPVITPLMSVSLENREGYDKPPIQAPPPFHDNQQRQRFEYQHQRPIRPPVHERFHWHRHSQPPLQPTQPNQQQGQPNQQQGMPPNQPPASQPGQQGYQIPQQIGYQPGGYPQPDKQQLGYQHPSQQQQAYGAGPERKDQDFREKPPVQEKKVPTTYEDPNQPPIHQYPPPGLEDQTRPPGTRQPAMVPPGVSDQPPPPGESLEAAKVDTRLAVNDVLAPPGEDTPVKSQPVDEESPGKSKKKKKQKKHRKHKKRKNKSSSEDERDPEAEKAAILRQLQSLQGDEEALDGAVQDVEDGEIESGEERAPVAPEVATPAVDEIKKKKKHKKEKKKHRKRKDESSDEEEDQAPPQLPPPPVPFFQNQPGVPMPGLPPRFDQNRPNFPGLQMKDQGASNDYPPRQGGQGYSNPLQHDPGQYPPRGISPSRDPHFRAMQERHNYMQQMRERGAGDPQHLRGIPDHAPHPMGPGGDHNPPQRKKSPSPLPLVIPTDPQEYEIWQRKMEARYNDGPDGHPRNHPNERDPTEEMEAARRRQGDSRSKTNEEIDTMMRMVREEEERRRKGGAGPPGEDQRKHGHGLPPRGRKRSRRHMRKNYHDWDRPSDDGLIYYLSDSGSSGWGSDANMDFDQMLAKKRRETGNDGRDSVPQTRSPHPPPMDMDMRRTRSPGHMMQWERRDRNDLPGGEKPQGIPVIGGGPRPIPTNVTSSRPTPPHRHPDMLPMDYLPPDIVKLPPQFPPGGYLDPHSMGARRDVGIPPQMPPGGHPIPRLSSQPPPGMPPMMIPMQGHQPGARMHPLDYDKVMRQRYGM